MPTKRIPTKEIGPKRGFGGRPRRAPISEKEDLEKCRGLARRSAFAAMQGYVEQLAAMKTIFWQGVPMCDAIDWETRQNAQREILDRAGIAKTMIVETGDPWSAFLGSLSGKLVDVDTE